MFLRVMAKEERLGSGHWATRSEGHSQGVISCIVRFRKNVPFEDLPLEISCC